MSKAVFDKNHELRTFDFEIETRASEDGDDVNYVVGYAAKYDQVTMIGGQFYESVERGAFDDIDTSFAVALFNHNWDKPLANSYSGLKLTVDNIGLRYEFPLGNQSYAKDLAENIRTGIVSTSSFGFTIKKDKWEKRNGSPYRRILKVDKVYDVSPTTKGAYSSTEVALRSMEEAMASVSDEEKIVSTDEVQNETIMEEVQQENVEQQHQEENVSQEAVVEAPPVTEQPDSVIAVSEQRSEIVEEVILIDQSILPHPYAVSASPKINENGSAAEATNQINRNQQNMENQNPTAAPAYVQALGDSESRAASRFSFGKMIKEAAQGRLTGIEAEMNQEARNEFAHGKVNVAGGICIPSFIVNRADAAPMGTATAGSTSVGFGGTIGIQDSGIVEAFRPSDIAAQIGVRNLNNLSGDVVFQVQAHASVLTADKPAQGAKQDSVNTSFAPVKLAPVRYSAHTRITDQMLAQSADDMGAFLAMDIRRAVDAKFNADIVAAVKAAADDWGATAGTLDNYTAAGFNPLYLEELLLAADVDLSNVSALSSAKAYRTLRTLGLDAGSGLLFAQSPLERRNVLGYNTVISSSVAAGEFFMMDRTQLVTGTWGGLNLIIDPYSDADYGVTRIVANVYRDVKTLQAKGFTGLTAVQP